MVNLVLHETLIEKLILSKSIRLIVGDGDNIGLTSVGCNPHVKWTDSVANLEGLLPGGLYVTGIFISPDCLDIQENYDQMIHFKATEKLSVLTLDRVGQVKSLRAHVNLIRAKSQVHGDLDIQQQTDTITRELDPSTFPKGSIFLDITVPLAKNELGNVVESVMRQIKDQLSSVIILVKSGEDSLWQNGGGDDKSSDTICSNDAGNKKFVCFQSTLDSQLRNYFDTGHQRTELDRPVSTTKACNWLSVSGTFFTCALTLNHLTDDIERTISNRLPTKLQYSKVFKPLPCRTLVQFSTLALSDYQPASLQASTVAENTAAKFKNQFCLQSVEPAHVSQTIEFRISRLRSKPRSSFAFSALGHRFTKATSAAHLIEVIRYFVMASIFVLLSYILGKLLFKQ